MIETENLLKEFTNMHDQFIRDWNKAMQTGDTSAVEKMADDYYVAFFKSGNEKPMFFNIDEAIDGMKQSVNHFLGASKNFENRVIRLRNQNNAVVFLEQLIIKDEKVLARLFTIENWEIRNGEWKITREIEESIH